MNHAPDAGMNRAPGAGMNNAPDAGMNHAPGAGMNNAQGAGSILRPVDLQSNVLSICYDCPHMQKWECQLFRDLMKGSNYMDTFLER